MKKINIPNGKNILNNISSGIEEKIVEDLSNEESLLYKISEKKFQTEEQVLITIQKFVKEMWNTSYDNYEKMGFTGDYEKLLSQDDKNIQEFLRLLSDGIFEMLKPALVSDEDGYRFDFSNKRLENILHKVDRQTNDRNIGTGLLPGEDNESIKFAMNQFKSFLSLAKARMKTSINDSKIPSTIRKHIEPRNKFMLAIETIILTSTFSFMSYGQHGFWDSVIKKYALDSKDTVNNIWATIDGNSLLHGLCTWGPGVVGASAIGGGLIKGMKNFRKRRIDRAEKEALNSDFKSESKLKKIGGIGKDMGFLLPGSILASFFMLYVEGTGMLANEAKGFYASKQSHDISKQVGDLLNLRDPNSSSSKIKLELDRNVAIIRNVSDQLPESEKNRAGAYGEGPAYHAKDYLRKGSDVLNEPILSKNRIFYNIVNKFDNEMNSLGKKYNSKYPSFPDKAEQVRTSYIKATNAVFDEQRFDEISNKRGNAGVLELEKAKHEYGELVSKYTDIMGKVEGNFQKRINVYKKFIEEISSASNKKYSSTTNFNLNLNFDIPDTSALMDELGKPLPRLEGKMAWEYWDVLKSLENTEGGITSYEKNWLLGKIAFRVLFFEVLAIFLLFSDILGAVKTYGRKENLLSKKEKALEGIYDSIVSCIHNTFSGKNWESIFPKGSGISIQEAEFILREILVGYNKNLGIYKHVVHEKHESTKGALNFGRNLTHGLKNIVTGDSRTDKEKYLFELNKVLIELNKKSKKDTNGFIIPEEVFESLVNRVLPVSLGESKFNGNTEEAKDFFHTVSAEISTKLGVLYDLSNRTINEESKIKEKQITERRKKLIEWKDEYLEEIQSRLEALILIDNSGSKKEVSLGSSILENIRKFKYLLDNEKPTIYEIKELEKIKDNISEQYDLLLGF